MTREQRAALRLAVAALHDAMRPLAVDANFASLNKDVSPPPMVQKRLDKYAELAKAAKTIETMLSQGSLL